MHIKHNKLILIALVTLLSVTVYGQRSLGLTVISSYGNNVKTDSFIISQSVGELMTETFVGTSGNYRLTQGFHQNWPYEVNMLEKPEGTFIGNVYPNPTRGIVYFDMEGIKDKLLKLDVYDVSGKMLKSEMMDLRFDNKTSLSEYDNGFYLIRLSNIAGDRIQTCKIEKTQ